MQLQPMYSGSSLTPTSNVSRLSRWSNPRGAALVEVAGARKLSACISVKPTGRMNGIHIQAVGSRLLPLSESSFLTLLTGFLANESCRMLAGCRMILALLLNNMLQSILLTLKVYLPCRLCMPWTVDLISKSKLYQGW
ncbi:hypothetical protein IF1G_00528 [Cordyceps javanica]|uniref:Uncharacterized protein n=1 Tax=Cordyceps javanica TaxID=43265 RepID=A0A545VFU7_9HYPO|nr:hypothetical protein IF1G_00528 [Cordyceps javanica]